MIDKVISDKVLTYDIFEQILTSPYLWVLAGIIYLWFHFYYPRIKLFGE